MSAPRLMVGATLPGSDRDGWTGEVGSLQKMPMPARQLPITDLPIRQELYAICVWPHVAFSQRATYSPSAAVRQRSIALITFNWSRLICPLLASRQAGP